MITHGRHDPCVGIRATPINEVMVAIVLMDHFLRHRAQNAGCDTKSAGGDSHGGLIGLNRQCCFTVQSLRKCSFFRRRKLLVSPILTTFPVGFSTIRYTPGFAGGFVVRGRPLWRVLICTTSGVVSGSFHSISETCVGCAREDGLG